MSPVTQDNQLRSMVRDGVVRAIGAIGLAGIALIHTIDAPGHFVGGPDTWLGLMYVGLIASSLILAAGLIASGDRRLWVAAAGLTATVMIGFVLSRTVGLPGDSGDVGNWGEALGIASLFVEGALLTLSLGWLSAERLELAARSVTRWFDRRRASAGEVAAAG